MQGFSFPFPIDHKYTALRMLGKGGGGQAVLAKKGANLFVIKFLNLSLAKNPQRAIEHFKKEFRTLKKLNHPHIARLYDFGFDDDLQLYYFAGEYLEAEEIHKACQQLSPEEIEKLFVQALQALHYLHTYGGKGLRHNDIKAANILVVRTAAKRVAAKRGGGHAGGSEPQLKLIDFGLANFAPLDVKGGTASYMSPEQIVLTFPELTQKHPLPKPDHRTDLYSLGVLWYYCLTGTNPFLVPQNRDATLQKHFGPPPPLPSRIKKNIPEYCDTIIGKLLQPHPDDRHESAAEVLQTLSYLSKKSYSVIPETSRQYPLPDGEWIGQQQVLKPLKQKWEHLLDAPHPQPTVVWVAGKQGQGKTRLLEHFKNHVQAHLSHSGRVLLLTQTTPEAVAEWSAEIDRFTNRFDEPLLIAVDNLSKNHPAWPVLEPLFEKAAYAKRWNSPLAARRLFLFTIPEAAEKREIAGFENRMLALGNFNASELRDLVQKTASRKEIHLPETFIQKLKNHTEGNPRFAASLLAELLHRDPALLHTMQTDFDRFSIPKDQKALLLKTWKNCNPEEKKWLEFLSCFPTGAGKKEIPDITSEYVTADEKGRLLFKNPFLQRIVYDGIPKVKKEKYHRAIAALYEKQNRPPHQIACHLAKGGSQEERLNALQRLSLFHEQTGKTAEALENRKEQMSLLSRAPLPHRLTAALHIIRLLNKLRHWNEALGWIQKWEKRITGRKAMAGWRTALLRERGMIFLVQNKIREARKCFEKAFQKIAGSKNHLKERLILQNTIAKTWLEERKLDKAIFLYRKTRKEAAKLPAAEALEVTNNDLGYALLLKQDAANAVRHLTEDLRFYAAGGAQAKRLRCHYLLGSCHRRLTRNFSEAIKQYQNAAEMAQNIRDHDWLMRAYNGLASTYLDSAAQRGGQNAYRQALRYFEESLALCRLLKKDPEELDFETAALHLNIGNVHKEMGHYSRARDSFNIILTVIQAKPKKHPQDWIRLCETQIALAECHAAEKRFRPAEEALKKAWAIAKASEGLREHQFAIQLVWAEAAKQVHQTAAFKKHYASARRLQSRHNIQPTPAAAEKMRELERP